jgi:hypothetical protein
MGEWAERQVPAEHLPVILVELHLPHLKWDGWGEGAAGVGRR